MATLRCAFALAAVLLIQGAAHAAAMTQEEAARLWEAGQLDRASSITLDSAREAFLGVSASAADIAQKEEATYRAAMCLYYIEKGKDGDSAFHKEAGDVIAAYPASPYTDDLALQQAMIFVDRGHWGFVVDQMTQFIAAYPQSPLVPQAEYHVAIAKLELGDEPGFLAAAQAFQSKWPGDPYCADLAYRQAMIPMRKEQWALAEPQLKAMAAQWPSSPWAAEAMYQAAMCAYGQGYRDLFAREADAFRSSYPESPRNADLVFYQARLAYKVQAWHEARAGFAAYTAAFPNSPHAREAFYLTALSAQRMGDAAGCTAALDSFKSLYGLQAPEALEIEFAQIQAMYEASQWMTANEKFLSIGLRADATSEFFEKSYFYAALCSLSMGDLTGFRESADNLVSNLPKGRVEELVTNRVDELTRAARFADAALVAHAFAQEYGSLREGYKFDLMEGVMRVIDAKKRQIPSERVAGVAALDRFLTRANAALEEAPAWLTEDKDKLGHLRSVVCEALFYRGDFDELLNRAIGFAKLVENDNSPMARADFLRWEGLARCHMPGGDLDLAAQAFDEVIAIGMPDPSPMEEVFGNALNWRIYLAYMTRDFAKAESLTQCLRERLPDSPYKQSVLARYTH